MLIRYQVLHPGAVPPVRATEGSAGYDVVAVDFSIKGIDMLTVESFDHETSPCVVTYHTGLAFQVPSGYCMKVYPRSGIYKTGAFLANGVALIDSDYRGELLLNFYVPMSRKIPYQVGDRIAQITIEPAQGLEFQEGNLDVTERGSGGFGSTGAQSLIKTRPSFYCYENSLGMEFQLIKAGTFIMGSKEDTDNPPHLVTLTKDFYLGAYEVTNAQYREFKRDHDSSGYKNYTLNGDDQPVVMVSWQDAVEFCRWLSQKEGKEYRLPTEAEWEYCCRAGRSNEESKYPWGSWWPPKGPEGNYGASKGYKKRFDVTSPVGSFDANPWGLYDMGGNVWEWCQDAYDKNLCKEDTINPCCDTGPIRVLRGASWFNSARARLRSAFRNNIGPTLLLDDLGFRVLLGVSGMSTPCYERSIRDLDVTVRSEPAAGLDRHRVSFHRHGYLLLTVVERSLHDAKIVLMDALDWIAGGIDAGELSDRFTIAAGLRTGEEPLMVRRIEEHEL